MVCWLFVVFKFSHSRPRSAAVVADSRAGGLSVLGEPGEALEVSLEPPGAEERQDQRRLGLALPLEEIELEKGEIGRPRRGGLADDGAHVIGLRLSFEPRGDVDVVADHRIIEARLRAEIADAANSGVQPDAEPYRLEWPALGLGLVLPERVQAFHLTHHAQCRITSMARMRVVVERRIPEGHHRVAHELVDGALLLENDVGKHRSLVAAAYRCGVPVFTSSPGDSSIGMNLAALQLEGSKLAIDPLRDVNQSASIVWDAKKKGRSGVLILGGGSPKNFILQTEPQIQEVLGLDESGHDYFLQFTDARPDTGGLSGATPQEAMTWGKVDPDQLPDTVTCYLDSTVALPLLTVYALATHSPRPLRRLMDRLEALTGDLGREYGNRRKGEEG